MKKTITKLSVGTATTDGMTGDFAEDKVLIHVYEEEGHITVFTEKGTAYFEDKEDFWGMVDMCLHWRKTNESR